MLDDIYWLASYPKSGNTWMRILLTNYLRDADEPADINSLDGGPIASARQLFDDHVGVEASDLTQDEIERLRPAVFEVMMQQRAREAGREGTDLEPMFLKVHDAYTYTVDDVPLLPKSVTGGAIYLLRNPLDVVSSFAHHNSSTVERMAEKMADSEFGFVDKGSKLHNQLRQRLLTWSQHVESWVDEPNLRTLVVRYEDLSSDTVEVFAEVLRFAGFEPESERVAKAVDFSRFDRLQEQEAESGFGEKMPTSESFFRKGEVGGWESELSTELADKVVADHQAVMERFGYR